MVHSFYKDICDCEYLNCKLTTFVDFAHATLSEVFWSDRIISLLSLQLLL